MGGQEGQAGGVDATVGALLEKYSSRAATVQRGPARARVPAPHLITATRVELEMSKTSRQPSLVPTTAWRAPGAKSAQRP